MLLTFMTLFICSAACNKDDESVPIKNNTPMTNGKIKIKIGSQTFTTKLSDNNSTKAFKELLPLTINMIELNGNEKYYDLPNNLPTNSANPKTIKKGDLMLYASKTLVLFYKNFPTSYSYTKLGSIDDVTGFESALGLGNTTVTFEVE